MRREIACIIVNYNDAKRVTALAKKLKQYGFFDRIVLSDNHSEEKDRCLLGDLEHEEGIHVLYNAENRGFGAGNNAALRYLETIHPEYVFLLNSDIDIAPKTLEHCAKVLKEHPDLAIVSPRMIEKGEIRPSTYLFPTVRHYVLNNLGLIKLFQRHAKEEDSPEEFSYVDYTRASCWCVRYDDLRSVGFFDESIFLYHEETCVALRLHRIGKRSAVLNHEFYQHNHMYSAHYKMNGYRNEHRSLKYIFRVYLPKNRLQLLLLDLSYGLGYLLRKLLGVK